MSSLRRIAILEDDDAVRKALGRLLSVNKFNVKMYETAAQLFFGIQSSPPDCFILDYFMTGMNGVEVHQRLREQGVNAPTIIITAHSQTELQQQCSQYGISAILTKPLQGEILIDTINLAIKSAQSKLPSS